jgi:hypothetical protein
MQLAKASFSSQLLMCVAWRMKRPLPSSNVQLRAMRGRTYAYAMSLCCSKTSFAIELGAAHQLASFLLASSSVAHRVDRVHIAVEMVM